MADSPQDSRSKAPKPSRERRDRRSVVAEMLANCEASTVIAKKVGRAFKTDPRTVRKDIALVHQEWAEEDASARPRMLSKFLRRLDEIDRRAQKKGQLGVCATVQALRLRFLEQTIDLAEKAELVTGGLQDLPWSKLLKAMQQATEEQERIKRIPMTLVDGGKQA